ncbi:LacI family DNA-binding transcriptional regulator [Pseudocolwellia agarivorans]|uniref:LacI family DNA-binding transcriptional regulator n=1 Tax=Pseudocolwellia agarivorans TaxID=1911682 RepID=UPI0009861264|nr:LacI family DNA-binding transcriptional regulator [Pseudocolwellia agarivorans]
MPTIKDVARIAGVSVATVSRVVNNAPKVSEKAKAKVNKVMEDLGYTPNANARALVMQKSTTMGVVIPDLTDPFFASLANGVEEAARENKMQLLLSTGMIDAESERKAITLLIEQQCDVLVVHSKKLSDEEIIKFAQKKPGLVLIDRYIKEIGNRCVWLDNLEGGKTAARHLLSLKHTEFACISSKYKIDDPELRTNGFQSEIEKAGYLLDKDLVEYGDPNLQGGEIATQKLLSTGKKFTAIFVYNDAMAIGAISTLENNGFNVPNDISVLGFDDVLLSRYSRPKLSTLHYPIKDMAIQAANIALAAVSNKTEESSKNNEYKYIPIIVKRESTSTKKAT